MNPELNPFCCPPAAVYPLISCLKSWKKPDKFHGSRCGFRAYFVWIMLMLAVC